MSKILMCAYFHRHLELMDALSLISNFNEEKNEHGVELIKEKKQSLHSRSSSSLFRFPTPEKILREMREFYSRDQRVIENNQITAEFSRRKENR